MTLPGETDRADPAPLPTGGRYDTTLQRLAALVLIAAPGLFAFLTFQRHYENTLMRQYAVPMVLAELALVVIFVLSGLDRFKPLRQPHLRTQLAALGLLAVAF